MAVAMASGLARRGPRSHGCLAETRQPLPTTSADLYSYDLNGNLTQHIDARGTVTTMTYDGLNRIKNRNYAVGTAASTPNVTYEYDQDFRGALSPVSTSASSTAYTHDAVGRVATSTQTTASIAYPAFHYSYSLSDQLTQVLYPSGRTVNYTLDSAGRTTEVKDGITLSNYATLTYKAPGLVNTLAMRNASPSS